MQLKIYSMLVFLGFAAATGLVCGQDAETDGESKKVEAAIQSYMAAFNARDVAKLVAHWSPDGVYISRTSGDQVVGRDAMKTEFTAMFEGESLPKLAATTESIDFISPNVALERGTATVTHSETDVSQSRYSVVYVKQGGEWLIDRVTEDEIVTQASNYDHLQDLEWLVGDWIDDSDETTIEMTCNWTQNQNYISRKYTVTSNGEVESSGLQVIGWDPQSKTIRSWLFDSSGGFVAGTWTSRDDRWVVQSVATLPDGASGSFTSVFRPLEDGNYSWKKINRVVDGQILPNVDESIVRRK